MVNLNTVVRASRCALRIGNGYSATVRRYVSVVEEKITALGISVNN